MTGQSEKSGIEIESEYQLTGHPVYIFYSQNKNKRVWAGKIGKEPKNRYTACSVNDVLGIYSDPF